MTEVAEKSQQAVALIKFFSEETHYLAFKGGHSLFRTPHYYRRHEALGRGDRSESCQGYWDTDLGDVIPLLKTRGAPLNLENAKRLFIYPASEQRDAWLQSWSVISPHNFFEKSIERMLTEFGPYFVVLPASNISAYASLLKKASGQPVTFGTIKYSDDLRKRSLRVKDMRFEYQKEFRFYVGSCEKDETKDLRLHLDGFSELLFEAPSLKFVSATGQITYCSLGHSRVVISHG